MIIEKAKQKMHKVEAAEISFGHCFKLAVNNREFIYIRCRFNKPPNPNPKDILAVNLFNGDIDQIPTKTIVCPIDDIRVVIGNY